MATTTASEIPADDALRQEAEAKFLGNEREDTFRYQLYNLNTQEGGSKSEREKSVLKVQKLVNRLRRFVDTDKDGVLSELARLDVSMHMSEVCDSICDGPLRLKDMNCLMEICSILYRQYGSDFSSAFCNSAFRAFSEAADVSLPVNATRRKSIPRLLIELVLVGVCQEAEALPKVINALCDTSRPSSEALVLHNIGVIEMLCRKFDTAILGGNPSAKQSALDAALGRVLERRCCLTKTTQAALRTKLSEFYRNSASALLQQAQGAVEVQASLNQQKRIAKGQVDSESEQKYQAALSTLMRLKTQLEGLADILGQPLPTCAQEPEYNVTRMQVDATTTDKASEKQQTQPAASPWEDEAERDFYENLLCLADAVPGSLLGVSSKEPSATGGTSLQPLSQAGAQDDDIKEPASETEQAQTAVTPATTKSAETGAKMASDIADRKNVLLDQFFEKLSQATLASEVDTLAINFFYDQLNVGKANRKRLVRLLLTTHRNDVFVLPALSRFVATINPYCKDVANAVVEGALHDYRELAAQRDPLKLESKIKAARYLGELCKFELIPTGTILDILSELLEDFSHVNVEVLCHLVQCCGRFLLHYKGLGERFRNTILTKMLRMKSVRNLPVYLEVMVEDTYFQIFPSELSAMPKKDKPTMHQYINYLITVVLQRGIDNQVVRAIRRLDWSDPKVCKWLHKAILQTAQLSTVAYQHLGTVASLLCALAPGRPEFVVRCIDDLMETIQLGLERNDFRESSYRVRAIKLVGELFNYRLMGTAGILDLLYHLIGFGGATCHRCSTPATFRRLAVTTRNTHLLSQLADGGGCQLEGLDYQTPVSPTPLLDPTAPEDPPNEFFRIRLVCVLLQTCGQFFSRGAAREKMERFLAFFQRYLVFKAPLPMSIHYIVLDSIVGMRPKFKLMTSLEQIDAAISTIVAQDAELETKDETEEPDEDDEGTPDIDGLNADDEEVDDATTEDSVLSSTSYSDSDVDEEDATSDKEGDGDEDDTNDEDESTNLESVEAAMFDLELSTLIGESIREAKSSVSLMRNRTSPMEEIRLPNLSKLTDVNASSEDVAPDRLRVRLITRRGAKDKIQVRTLDIPKDSRLSQAMFNKEIEDAEEHARLKQFVLDSVIRSRKQEVTERENQIRRHLFVPAGRSGPSAVASQRRPAAGGTVGSGRGMFPRARPTGGVAFVCKAPATSSGVLPGVTFQRGGRR